LISIQKTIDSPLVPLTKKWDRYCNRPGRPWLQYCIDVLQLRDPESVRSYFEQVWGREGLSKL
jgi:hypothetical protein